MRRLLLLLALATVATTASAIDDAGDRAALLDLFASTGGSQWILAENWTSSESFCTWFGVECSCAGAVCRVAALDVHANNLRGVLRDSIGALTQLAYLDVGRNAGLGGAVPASLGNLTQLVNLRLGDSALNGTVPAALANLLALQQLDLVWRLVPVLSWHV